jgi:hypothetical protein
MQFSGGSMKKQAHFRQLSPPERTFLTVILNRIVLTQSSKVTKSNAWAAPGGQGNSWGKTAS